MSGRNLIKITKGVFCILFLATLMPTSISFAISNVPTVLTPAEEEQLLLSCSNLNFLSNLYPGYFNTRVECLQLLLKQNPIIYPEGLVTGFYGRLTKRAVARLNQLVDHTLEEENYFFDYNARIGLNAHSGEARLDWIKNLTLSAATATTATTKAVIIPSTTLPGEPATTNTTIVAPTTVSIPITTLAVTTTLGEKMTTFQSWWQTFNIRLARLFSLFKKPLAGHLKSTTTLINNSNDNLDVPSTTKAPNFLVKILTNLGKVKILNHSLIKSSEKEIITFTLPDFNSVGTIDQQNHTIKIQVPNGVDLKNLKPTISISSKASLAPQPEQARDYSQPVIYTVMAENGSATTYTVTVVEAPKSFLNTLLSFRVKEYESATIIDNQINVVNLTLPLKADLTNVTIMAESDPYSEIEPLSGTSLNLNQLKTISVRAQNGDLRMYSLRVTRQPLATTTLPTATVPITVADTSLQSAKTTTSSTTMPVIVTSTISQATTTITTMAEIQATTQTTKIMPTTAVTLLSTSTTKAQPISVNITTPTVSTAAATTSTSTTATTLAVSTTETKASSTIIIDETSTTSLPQTTSTLESASSALINDPSSKSSNATVTTTPLPKSSLPIGLRDFLSLYWETILIGFVMISLLELTFVLLKTGAIDKILGRGAFNTGFISYSLSNPKIQVSLDSGKHLILLYMPAGEQVLAKELTLTHNDQSRLVFAPPPEAILKNGDTYVLASLEGDQFVYTVKINKL